METRVSIIQPFENVLKELLKKGVTNSQVCCDIIKGKGYKGSVSSIKRFITSNKDLVPAKRFIVAPQGVRCRRWTSDPGDCYEMDWGFVTVVDEESIEWRAACFAMICHHCGLRYVEFFPNAKQENLLIGMIHAFGVMGVPRYVLTDNMKSVVIDRNAFGEPIWNINYSQFMEDIGFKTKLCKPCHPFTKGQVERLVRFVKENFLVGRVFLNVTDLNNKALKWCDEKNALYHKELNLIPIKEHFLEALLKKLPDPSFYIPYLCPERAVSFDGYIDYEGRRFGVPYSYLNKKVRVSRKDEKLLIYDLQCSEVLVTHQVTWSKKPTQCEGQWSFTAQEPEEFPTAPIKTKVTVLAEKAEEDDSFNRFLFEDMEDVKNANRD